VKGAQARRAVHALKEASTQKHQRRQEAIRTVHEEHVECEANLDEMIDYTTNQVEYQQ